MPAIKLFNRSWNVSSDEFVFCSIRDAIFHLIFLVSVLVFSIKSLFIEAIYSFELKLALCGSLCLLFIGFLISILLSIFSGLGSILEDDKRYLVPKIIYVKIILKFIKLAWFTFTLYTCIETNTLSDKNRTLIIIFGLLLSLEFLKGLFVLLTWKFIYRVKYQPLINEQVSEKFLANVFNQALKISNEKKQLVSQLKCLFCYTCATKKNKLTYKQMFNLIADSTLMLFDRKHLVPSDIVIGLYLVYNRDRYLGDFHNCSTEKVNPRDSFIFTSYNTQNIQEYNLVVKSRDPSFLFNLFGKDDSIVYIFDKNTNANNDISNNNGVERRKKENSRKTEKPSFMLKNEVQTNKSSLLTNLKSNKESTVQRSISEPLPKRVSSFSNLYNSTDNSERIKSDWRDLRSVYYFCRIAKAAYGWQVNILLKDRYHSRFKIWCHTCCRCCKKCHAKYLQVDTSSVIIYPPKKRCPYLINSIISTIKMNNQILTHVSISDDNHMIPFFVMVAPDFECIIIAIRGTLSSYDIMIDLDSEMIPFVQSKVRKAYAHSGMSKVALNIYNLIKTEMILHNLLALNEGYRIVTTGHSLGAGVAILLSILLKKEFPLITCYAFGPPLGTVNSYLANFCSKFVLSVVNGFDMMPRTSLNTLTLLKDEIYVELERCTRPKFMVQLKMFFRSACCRQKHTNELNIMNAYEKNINNRSDEHVTDAVLPGQIMHIVDFSKLQKFDRDNIIRDVKEKYAVVITPSFIFGTLLVHRRTISDHIINRYANRLLRILKQNFISPNLRFNPSEKNINSITQLLENIQTLRPVPPICSVSNSSETIIPTAIPLTHQSSQSKKTSSYVSGPKHASFKVKSESVSWYPSHLAQLVYGPRFKHIVNLKNEKRKVEDKPLLTRSSSENTAPNIWYF